MSIAITLHYRCSGCMATEDRQSKIDYIFTSFSGRDWGVGTSRHTPTHEVVEESTPEGWVAFDPYTNTTYCGKCWEEIMSSEPDPPK